jgi:hypothetical protein
VVIDPTIARAVFAGGPRPDLKLYQTKMEEEEVAVMMEEEEVACLLQQL